MNESPRTESIVIRDLRKSDLDDILDTLSLSLTDEFTVTGFDLDRAEEMLNQMFGIVGRIFLGIPRMLGKEPMRILVAELDNRAVGTTVVSKRREVGYISSVMVHPTYRRRGIAGKLMNKALDYAKKRKMARAVLHVLSTNVPANRLYAELGFKEFERIAYYAGNLDSLSQPKSAEGVCVRDFQKNDIDAVYALTKSSEDPKHLEIFGFKKRDLKTRFIQRIFHFSTENRIVAQQDKRVIGYARAIYTTPKEAGEIKDLHVHPSMKSRGIEEILLHSGVDKIRKIGTERVVATASFNRPELIVAMNRLGFKRSFKLRGMVTELL